MRARWSAITAHLPKRTDNEVKNYWHSRLKKRLELKGYDPVTHRPKTTIFGFANGSTDDPKTGSNLNHIAQWESARLQAEARFVRDSDYTNKLIIFITIMIFCCLINIIRS
ncbi:transcription factor MYB32 [Prunus yedoensis var. nudiflora]|uniref:Transcription factor MYB32 n=1 Tax=Prunus yedoensis var. nudiflora TaxID=2094558 RepID=A0A314Y5E1_PRUYE|nr:transcription factor MYB32 [Prunus yedoensis var. nudiflora]